jgi:hypothetical protein
MIADLKMRALAAVLFVLRITADGGELENSIARANACRPGDDCVRPDSCSGTDGHFSIND